MPKLGMCQRCHFFIVENCTPCKQCGKVDNDFCSSCHTYNHRFDAKLKYLGNIQNQKELEKSGQR